MAKEAKTEDAKQMEAVSNIPDFGDEFEGDIGIEGGAVTFSSIPVLKLTQAMSPEVQDRNFPDVYAGMFINDTTKECLGEEVTCRILRTWRSRAKFVPREAGSGIECSCPTYNSPDGDFGSEYGSCRTCMYNNFTQSDHCLTQYNMIITINDNPTDMYRVILSKTSFKAGRTLDTALRALSTRYKRQPIFMFKVKISAKEATNTKIGSKYFVYKLDVIPPKADEPLLNEDSIPEYIDAMHQIADIRTAQLEYHKRQLTEKSSFDTAGAQTSTDFEKMGTTLAAELAPGGSEEIPF